MQRSGTAVDGKGISVAEHLVATTRDGDRSLLEPERARWLWEHLREGLPQALSSVLMPDHAHRVTPPGRRPRFRRILAAFTIRFGVRFDVVVQPANSLALAGRAIRYGFRNPDRAGLVEDPWCWSWSTLRDLGGASHPVWTPLPRIAAFLDLPPPRALRALTTTGDQSFPPPRPARIRIATDDVVRTAVASVLRIPEAEVLAGTTGRRLLVQTLYELGDPNAHRLAADLGCNEKTIRRDRAQPHPGLDAVLLCLGDARLQVGVEELRRGGRRR